MFFFRSTTVLYRSPWHKTARSCGEASTPLVTENVAAETAAETATEAVVSTFAPTAPEVMVLVLDFFVGFLAIVHLWQQQGVLELGSVFWLMF